MTRRPTPEVNALPELPSGWSWSIGNYSILAYQVDSPHKTVLMEGDEICIGGDGTVPASVVSAVIAGAPITALLRST